MSKQRCNTFNNLSTFHIKQMIDNGMTQSDILRNVGLTARGGNYKTLQKFILDSLGNAYILKIKDNKNEYLRKTLKKSNTRRTWRQCLDEIFVENSTGTKRPGSYRDYLIKYGDMIDECAICGLVPEWNGKKLVLQIDHINGVHTDNRLENLRFLCPNCHSQTETFGRKRSIKVFKTNNCLDCGCAIYPESERCVKCANKYKGISLRKIDWPSHEELIKEVQESNWTKVGEKYGVSDNAVRKYFKRHGYEIKGKEVFLRES